MAGLRYQKWVLLSRCAGTATQCYTHRSSKTWLDCSEQQIILKSSFSFTSKMCTKVPTRFYILSNLVLKPHFHPSGCHEVANAHGPIPQPTGGFYHRVPSKAPFTVNDSKDLRQIRTSASCSSCANLITWLCQQQLISHTLQTSQAK